MYKLGSSVGGIICLRYDWCMQACMHAAWTCVKLFLSLRSNQWAKRRSIQYIDPCRVLFFLSPRPAYIVLRTYVHARTNIMEDLCPSLFAGDNTARTNKLYSWVYHFEQPFWTALWPYFPFCLLSCQVMSVVTRFFDRRHEGKFTTGRAAAAALVVGPGLRDHWYLTEKRDIRTYLPTMAALEKKRVSWRRGKK